MYSSRHGAFLFDALFFFVVGFTEFFPPKGGLTILGSTRGVLFSELQIPRKAEILELARGASSAQRRSARRTRPSERADVPKKARLRRARRSRPSEVADVTG